MGVHADFLDACWSPHELLPLHSVSCLPPPLHIQVEPGVVVGISDGISLCVLGVGHMQ